MAAASELFSLSSELRYCWYPRQVSTRPKPHNSTGKGEPHESCWNLVGIGRMDSAGRRTLDDVIKRREDRSLHRGAGYFTDRNYRCPEQSPSQRSNLETISTQYEL